VSRSVPEGTKQFTFEFPIKEYKNILITTDELHIVCYCFEKLKESGFLVSKDIIHVKKTIQNSLRLKSFLLQESAAFVCWF
jgi:hypothetical protein